MPILTLWPNSYGVLASEPLSHFPRVLTDQWGWTMIGAFVYDSGSSGPGKVRLKVRGPGDHVFGPRITVPFELEPVGFDVSPAPSRTGSWIMTAVPSGETDPAEYESTDQGATWTRL